MADEQDKLKLSLEPPKLFGRKKKPATPADTSEPAQPVRPAAATPVAAPAPEPEPTLVVEPVVPPVIDHMRERRPSIEQTSDATRSRIDAHRTSRTAYVVSGSGYH